MNSEPGNFPISKHSSLDITEIIYQLLMGVVSRQRARFGALLDGAVVGPLGDGVDLGGAEGLEDGVAPLEALRLHPAVVVEVGETAPLSLDGQAIFGRLSWLTKHINQEGLLP